jgi:hypothetical protein
MIIHSPIFSGSINQAATSYANLSGSFSGSFTGSFKGDGSLLGGVTANSITYENVTGKPTLVSGSSQVSYPQLSNIPSGIISSSAQIDALFNIDGIVSGSSQVIGILSSLNTYTSSNDTTNTTQTSRLNQLSTASGSAITRLTALEVETLNLELYTASNDTKWSTLGSLSGSFARTNSTNIFSGNQTITGSLFVSQDLIVQGSSSIQNVSSSVLNIGTNLITVAVNQPSVRFGGLAVIDSGSAGQSGSFLYDSVQDEFIFLHRGDGTNITSSHFVLGPETYNNLGNETYLTNNRVSKGTGKEHLVDSNITDTGTLITLGSNSVVTGTLLATGTVLVSGSSQISHDSTTGYSANRHIDHTAVSITAGNGLTGGGDISSTRDLNVVGTTNRISVSADAVDIASTYVGQTSITTLGTIGTGVWQGSVIASAYLDADTAHLSDTQTFTGAKTFSSAVNITNNTASTTITTGALIVTGGVGVSGALNVGGDVVAYASSDERLKNNIEVISNPIQKVQQLKGVTWEWNENADELQQSLPNVGVIAQDVEKVLPQLVHNRENGFKGVDYAKLTGLLIEAIKEQQKQIDELKSRL